MLTMMLTMMLTKMLTITLTMMLTKILTMLLTMLMARTITTNTNKKIKKTPTTTTTTKMTTLSNKASCILVRLPHHNHPSASHKHESYLSQKNWILDIFYPSASINHIFHTWCNFLDSGYLSPLCKSQAQKIFGTRSVTFWILDICHPKCNFLGFWIFFAHFTCLSMSIASWAFFPGPDSKRLFL